MDRRPGPPVQPRPSGPFQPLRTLAEQIQGQQAEPPSRPPTPPRSSKPSRRGTGPSQSEPTASAAESDSDLPPDIFGEAGELLYQEDVIAKHRANSAKIAELNVTSQDISSTSARGKSAVKSTDLVSRDVPFDISGLREQIKATAATLCRPAVNEFIKHHSARIGKTSYLDGKEAFEISIRVTTIMMQPRAL